MINKESIIADLHTHTIFSKHAHSTLKENLDCARENGMKFVAVTDHFFQNGDKLERKNALNAMMNVSDIKPKDGIRVIAGGEFNINQPLLPDVNTERLMKKVKWRLIGLHNSFLDVKALEVEDIAAEFEKAVNGENGLVKPTAFAHIERVLNRCKGADDAKRMKNTLYEIVDLAADNGVYLEINEHSLQVNREHGAARLKIWLARAKERNARLCLGTDAHYCEQVGDFTETLRLPRQQHLHFSINMV